jgi:helix-turn-helix protein
MKIETDECLTTSVPDAGKLIGIGRNAAYEAARRGDIPTIKIGKRVVVPTALLKRMLGLGAQ